MRTSLLLCAAAGLVALAACTSNPQTVSGPAAPLTPASTPSPTPPASAASTPAATDTATPTSTPGTSPAPAAACPVSANVLLTATYRAGKRLAYPESEPIDCWGGYATVFLVAGSGNTHPGDTGRYIFGLDGGQWRLLTSGAVAQCTPYIPAAYLSQFPRCP